MTKLAPSRSPSSNVTYAGKFSAIYDGAGNNLAPSGASKLIVNGKTGHLVSFQ